MERAIDVARYFISLDIEHRLFNKELITRNGRSFYEGNARLNKYLQMAQNVYIAKTGNKLFEDDMYAYDNGAVVLRVQENYSILIAKKKDVVFSEDISLFLKKIFNLLENATIDELIELSHEDDAWASKHTHYFKDSQKMDSLDYASEYKEQYADVLLLMEKMPV